MSVSMDDSRVNNTECERTRVLILMVEGASRGQTLDSDLVCFRHGETHKQPTTSVCSDQYLLKRNEQLQPAEITLRISHVWGHETEERTRNITNSSSSTKQLTAANERTITNSQDCALFINNSTAHHHFSCPFLQVLHKPLFLFGFRNFSCSLTHVSAVNNEQWG